MYLTHLTNCYMKRRQLKHAEFFFIDTLSIKRIIVVLPVSHSNTLPGQRPLVLRKIVSKETDVMVTCILANMKCVIVNTDQEEFMLGHIVKF